MKTNILWPAFALLLGLPPGLSGMELPVGNFADNQAFALRTGTTFTAKSFDDYEGKILVIMLMTPWCPICQSNTTAVGDGILDPLNAISRGALKGKNDAGVEVASLMLSTEEAQSWDATNQSFSTAQGFQQWGLDATLSRSNPRVILGYLRGGYISGSNLYAWGNDRRRVVVLNLVKRSPSHGHRQILLNQNYFDSSQSSSALAAINAVQPAPALTTFSVWSGSTSIPAGMASPESDPDGDGMSNLLEFYHGTNPLVQSQSGVVLENQSGTWKLKHVRAKNTAGLKAEYLASDDLVTWTVFSATPVVSDLGEQEAVGADLPASASAARFFRIRVVLE